MQNTRHKKSYFNQNSGDFMQTHEKLREIRLRHRLTQDEFAEKIGLALNTYGKIERGETDIKTAKLKEIAKIMNIDPKELIDSNENTILNFAEKCNHNNHFQCHIVLSETQCAHELEKAHLIIEQKDKELALMKQQIEDLRAMLNLVKTT
jgi:transcriptional regulator with XRE-family HTH domain